MSRRGIILSVFLILIPNFASPQPFEPPSRSIEGWVKGKYSVTKETDKPETIVNFISRMSEYTEAAYEIVEKEHQRYYRIQSKDILFNKQRIEQTVLLKIDKYLKPCSYNLIRRNPDGEVIENWEVGFGDMTWNHPKDMYPKLAIHLLVSQVSHPLNKG